ncbi:MAG: universal stress protein [Proteobacteria bacterium]|nr:universal stress protein [Pseudomonadota bacterium]
MATALHHHPPFKNVMLATDLAEGAAAPWAHALKLCSETGADLTALHVRKHGETSHWTRLPTARQLLVDWGLLDYDATTSDFRKLGFRIHLKSIRNASAREGISVAMRHLNPDLVVLGTHRPRGIDRLVEGSVGASIAREAPHAALVVQRHARPLVHLRRGTIGFPRVLVPISSQEDQQAAVDGAVDLIDGLWHGATEFVLLHVGPRGQMPLLKLPSRPHWSWRTEYADGAVVPSILHAAERLDVSAVAMVTHGHDSLMDSVMGSRADRIIQGAECPVLVIPAAA